MHLKNVEFLISRVGHAYVCSEKIFALVVWANVLGLDFRTLLESSVMRRTLLLFVLSEVKKCRLRAKRETLMKKSRLHDYWHLS